MNNLDRLKTKIKKVKIDNELITVKRHMKKLQNENKLDCRKDNLQLVTPKQNAQKRELTRFQKLPKDVNFF